MFGSRFALAFLALFAFVGAALADEQWVYFGTYTGGKDGSKGIYRAKLDTETGKLTTPELAAEVGSPSFLAVHPSGKFLYAVGESGGKDGGGVFAFALDPKTGELTKLNERTSGGGGPCHIAVHPKGTHAIVANYGGGSTAAFAIGNDGKLSERTSFIQHKGSGPDKGRQSAPHGHCSKFDDAADRAYTVDLGLDKVKVFAFDPATGKLTETDADMVLPPASGPRHMTQDGDTFYVCGEMDSTVNVVQRDPSANTFKTVQSLSTLKSPVKGNSTAECIQHPSKKYVYVSNRGHNSVAAFKVGADHKLTAIGHITGDIKIPRNFNVDPTGRWMLIASQDGGKVGVWEIDPATGLGKETGVTVPIKSCVCVKFVPVAK